MQGSKAVQTIYKEKPKRSFLFYQEVELLMQLNFIQDFLYLFLNKFWGRLQLRLGVYLYMEYYTKNS